MHTGKTYEHVIEVIGDTFNPAPPDAGVQNEALALRRLGYEDKNENGEAVGDFVCLYRQNAISPEYFRSMAWGRRALMSVPSLNHEGGWHMVYWDGRVLFDPSSQKTYERWAQLRPDYLTLFQN